MNQDVAEKYAAVLNILYTRTLKQSVRWTLNGDRTPKCEFANYIIRLYDGWSGGNPMEFVSVSTEYDETIEVVSDDDLVDILPKNMAFDTYYLMMKELRSLAFRQAVGADKALDDLLRKLGDDVD